MLDAEPSDMNHFPFDGQEINLLLISISTQGLITLRAEETEVLHRS